MCETCDLATSHHIKAVFVVWIIITRDNLESLEAMLALFDRSDVSLRKWLTVTKTLHVPHFPKSLIYLTDKETTTRIHT